jgi:hypothetical protein
MTAPAREADAAHDLSGAYSLTVENLTMTLVPRQDAQGAISGRISSTSAARFQVDGREQDGMGVGTCVGKQGGSYFEAHPEGEQLLLAFTASEQAKAEPTLVSNGVVRQVALSGGSGRLFKLERGGGKDA